MLNSLTVEQSRQIQVQILFEQPSATRIPTKLPLASQTQQEGGDMWLAEALYKKRSKWWAVNRPICGCSLTVKPRSSKPAMWFRLPSFAPIDFEQNKLASCERNLRYDYGRQRVRVCRIFHIILPRFSSAIASHSATALRSVKMSERGCYCFQAE